MKATLDRIEQVGPNTATFWFKPENYVQYTAGQFIELTLSHENPDIRSSKRWFTLSSSPTENLLAITTKHSPNSSSFKEALWNLKRSDIVAISQPMGDFVLPMQKSVPVLFIVAGIGITPVRSIIRSLIDQKIERDIQVLYLAQDKEHHLFKHLISDYTQNASFIDSDQISLSALSDKATIIFKNKKGLQVYISGPEKFVELMQNHLQQSDIPMSHVLTDFFHGYDA